ncbi:hypothetical protein AQUCO_05800020v1 [Aquilegia coerulea]|uniref:Glycosyltransferase n=1 Tax=Aquilegia coerulea TaxID=218851 RepID=A0A2G5CEB7_AQUCA|nr:hypothetical protein AQUCO_05800020v1 [Aquilegia coerulea]
MGGTGDNNGTVTTGGHVLLLAYPAQGHINPILQFAKRLASKGLKTTLATTVYLSNNMHLSSKDCKVGIETFSDGFDQTGPAGAETGVVYLRVFKQLGSQTLANIIRKYDNTNNPITCLVCDSIIPWGLDVGRELGLVTASFFTQTCSVSSIFYHIKQGNLSVPVEESTAAVCHLPGLPQLALQDFPSCVVVLEPTPPTSLNILLGQFSNIEKADWLLFNTFDQLESQVLQWMGDLWRVRTIGPTTPSMYLDKRVEGDTENSLNMFKPSDVSYYIKWLNTKETGSVLYISFGSIAELGKEQMEEVIWGIKQSDKDFIWVVREKEQSKLPTNLFSVDDDDEMMMMMMVNKKKQGLLVPWCSQLEVLGHEAIGCFLTHCGWNSTMEALSLGVPMVAMPQIWDQFTNAKFVEDVWGVGIRAKINDGDNKGGIVTREELEWCIREVMDEDKKGMRKFKKNASLWRELAKDAVGVGGSSDLNIEEFVASIS